MLYSDFINLVLRKYEKDCALQQCLLHTVAGEYEAILDVEDETFLPCIFFFFFCKCKLVGKTSVQAFCEYLSTLPATPPKALNSNPHPNCRCTLTFIYVYSPSPRQASCQLSTAALSRVTPGAYQLLKTRYTPPHM